MTDERTSNKNEPGERVSRRDFLKYSAGVAAALGAGTVLAKTPLLSREEAEKTANAPVGKVSGPIVATVEGEVVTVMSGQTEVRVKDSGLAAAIANKVN
ncbi:MAG TPA: twin-arginine translocation signal domain-containing protein [Candidatus Bathyarchaeia archaeon]